MSVTQTILEDLKREFFEKKNTINKVILFNFGVFICLNIFKLVAFLFDKTGVISSTLVTWLSVPADLKALLFRPWTLLTYMFLHEGVFHIFFNMWILFWFGKIFREFLGDKKVLPVYILGGLLGAVFYIISFNVFPAFTEVLPIAIALGASASVMAIVLATTTLLPDFEVRLTFIGSVKLKHIALVIILIDILSIAQSNSGGHLAHLGGALFGFLYVKQLRSGRDLGAYLSKFIEKLTNKSKPKPKVVYSNKNTTKHNKKTSKNSPEQQAKIDAILDRIAESGYDSLTKAEKDFLFNASKN